MNSTPKLPRAFLHGVPRAFLRAHPAQFCATKKKKEYESKKKGYPVPNVLSFLALAFFLIFLIGVAKMSPVGDFLYALSSYADRAADILLGAAGLQRP